MRQAEVGDLVGNMQAEGDIGLGRGVLSLLAPFLLLAARLPPLVQRVPGDPCAPGPASLHALPALARHALHQPQRQAPSPKPQAKPISALQPPGPGRGAARRTGPGR